MGHDSHLVALKDGEFLWVIRRLPDFHPGALGLVQEAFEDLAVDVARDEIHLSGNLQTQMFVLSRLANACARCKGASRVLPWRGRPEAWAPLKVDIPHQSELSW